MSETKQTMQEILDEVGISMPAGTMELADPFMQDGESVRELRYDFSKVTGRDSMRITSQLRSEGLLSDGQQKQDPNYCAAVFAVAAGLEFHDLDRMGIEDFNEAANLATLFFIWKASRTAPKTYDK